MSQDLAQLRLDHERTWGLPQTLAALVAGAATAVGFAWFMYFLVTASEMRLSASDRVHLLDFVRVKRSEDVQRKDRKPERPPASDTPEAPPMPNDSSTADAGQQLAVTAPSTGGADLNIGGVGAGLGMGDGEYLPIVKVAPAYPRRALQRALEGTCLVRYTVTTLGTVKDVEVVMEQCSDPVFARPSIEAAQRFRYKPRVIDGTAIEVHGVYNMFHFEKLEEQAQ